MRRVELAICTGIVALAALRAYAPRLDNRFPSMTDDWSAIANAPDQLRAVLLLENPESQRYRPGFIVWNALQWHTLGAPDQLVGPQVWGVLRLAVLVVGLTLLAALLIAPRSGRDDGFDPRWLLVAGAPLAVITPPPLGIDLARFGPQEPLLVGCMALGAVLLVRSLDRLLETGPPGAAVVATVVGGLLVWSFGVLQKETSLCVLVVLPFLALTIRGQKERWARLSDRRRAAIGAVAGAILLPFVPMALRTIQLSLADTRVYEDATVGRSFVTRLWDQLQSAEETLHAPVLGVIVVVALAVVAVRATRHGVDWLTVGLFASAAAFVAFAAASGVVASRYYLPPLALVVLALARVVAALGRRLVVVTAVALAAAGLLQAREAHDFVVWWVEGEQANEGLVRAAAQHSGPGCTVDATGAYVELVQALPVLMPLADEPRGHCNPPERFLVVIDGYSGTNTADDDPTVAACAPEPEPILTTALAKMVRCTT